MKINVFCQEPYCQNFEQREYIPGKFIGHFWCEKHKHKKEEIDKIQSAIYAHKATQKIWDAHIESLRKAGVIK